METQFNPPQGEFILRRYPQDRSSFLRAWDAADEYILAHLAEHSIPDNARLVILNDAFGALSTALHRLYPVAISDSWISRQATIHNLTANNIAVEAVTWLSSLEKPGKPVDVLLIKIPKTLALLEHQLHELRPLLHPDSIIIAAGMVKNMPKTVWAVLERLLGPTTTSLARKKPG